MKARHRYLFSYGCVNSINVDILTFWWTYGIKDAGDTYQSKTVIFNFSLRNIVFLFHCSMLIGWKEYTIKKLLFELYKVNGRVRKVLSNSPLQA